MADSPEHQSILDSLRRLVEALRASSRETEKELGISGAQHYVLQKLSIESGLSMNELAERTFTHQSSVSVVVTRLEERKLVERRKSASDARRVEIHLTARGKSVLARAPSPIQDRILQAIEGFSMKDRQILASLLGELNRQAGFAEEAVPLFFEGEKK